MRRTFFSLLILGTLSSFTAHADEISVESKIRAATVYSDRATLTRQAKVTVPAGAHTLVFKGLPISIFADSLRSEGKTQGKIRFGAISHKIESHEDYVVPKEKEIRAQIELLNDQKKTFEDEKNAVLNAHRFLEKLGEQAILRAGEEIAQINLKPEEWKGAADAIYSKSFENLKAVSTLDISIRTLDKQIKKLEDELAQLRTGDTQNILVKIPLEADSETALIVDLSYQIPNVSWQPVYDARLDTSTGKLELIQYGEVWQQTGEDWEGIELTLSTAQPSRGAGLPDLYTHWVNLIAPVNPMPMAAAMNGASVAMDAAAPQASLKSLERALVVGESAIPTPVEPVEFIDAEFISAEIDTEGFVGAYKITGSADVKSDGTHSKHLIGTFDTESILQVQVKPQISTEAFLVAKTKLKGDSPVLPGQVNLFRDGAFIGQHDMQMLRPEDEEILAFGVDDNVRVKRNILKDENAESGLISKENVLERHFITEVQNLHKNAIDVVVLETVPVSQNERIRVEILKDKTTPGYVSDLDNVKGATQWTAKLEAGAKGDVALGWKVTWPKGENITGL